MKRMGNKLYDLVEVVKKTALHTEVLQMNIGYNIFHVGRLLVSIKVPRVEPRPYIKDMFEVVFTRKSKNMKYKNIFNELEH